MFGNRKKEKCREKVIKTINSLTENDFSFNQSLTYEKLACYDIKQSRTLLADKSFVYEVCIPGYLSRIFEYNSANPVCIENYKNIKIILNENQWNDFAKTIHKFTFLSAEVFSLKIILKNQNAADVFENWKKYSDYYIYNLPYGVERYNVMYLVSDNKPFSAEEYGGFIKKIKASMLENAKY